MVLRGRTSEAITKMRRTCVLGGQLDQIQCQGFAALVCIKPCSR